MRTTLNLKKGVRLVNKKCVRSSKVKPTLEALCQMMVEADVRRNEKGGSF